MDGLSISVSTAPGKVLVVIKYSTLPAEEAEARGREVLGEENRQEFTEPEGWRRGEAAVGMRRG